jgi:hypothetical protein
MNDFNQLDFSRDEVGLLVGFSMHDKQLIGVDYNAINRELRISINQSSPEVITIDFSQIHALIINGLATENIIGEIFMYDVDLFPEVAQSYFKKALDLSDIEIKNVLKIPGIFS